jgi:cytosine/adenosine deaminase-related metal-dependent hydrolase
MKKSVRSAPQTLIRNGLVVTMNEKREVFSGDVLIEGERIKKVGRNLSRVAAKGARVIDAKGGFIIPGLIQAHTHLCQTLFRGYADDLALLDWLKKKIWPMESSHNKASLRASARVGLYEMQMSGTTSILDMGTVRHTETLLETAHESGVRYWGGKCLMDRKDSSGPLYEATEPTLKETEDFLDAFAGTRNGSMVNYVLCPRFAISCTDGLMEAMGDYQKRYGAIIHTHASESLEEIKVIKSRTGFNNVDYFADLGLLNPKTVIVHGVHLTDDELHKMIDTGAPLVHCPSSNLKLGSGIAPTEKYTKKKLKLGLGSDGAPCNNSMDQFIEMRLAALVQKPVFGPEALPAETAFELATLGGARTLGMEHELGSLEAGKLADIVIVDRSHPSVNTIENPYSALVYSCLGRDVTDVIINGRVIVRSAEHQVYDGEEVLTHARKELKSLLKRASVQI